MEAAGAAVGCGAGALTHAASATVESAASIDLDMI